MPPIEWFYAKNDQPCGPVSPVELKQFAEQGELHAEDLVWREGMGEWIPAAKIKGLFDSNGEEGPESEQGAEPAAEQVAEPEVATHQSPPRGEVPAGAIPDPPAAAAELPIRSAPPTDREIREPEPKIETKTPTAPKAESVPLRHPLDMLAELARTQFNAHFVHSTVVLFRVGGQIGVVLAIVAVIFLAVAVGSKAGTTAVTLPLAAIGVVGLLLGQYVGRQVFPAVERLDLNARATLWATKLLDSLAAVMTVLGLTALLGLAGFAMATSTAWPAFLAVAIFIVCQFTAVVAWNPRAVWLDIGRPASAGREAAAQICFLGKLLWRLSVVAYGVGILLGSIATLNVAVHIGLPDEPDPRWFTAELYVPLCLLLAAVPLPALGYVAFLVCQFLSEAVARPANWGRRR